MFSQMIQSLLSNGGKSAAMQRYAALNNQVDYINKNERPASLNPIDTIYPANNPNTIQSFENILQSSTKSNFGSLLLGPQSMKVNADLVKNNSAQSLTNALNEISGANAVSSASAVSVSASKSQILNMISKISEKHGVDEKLVKALIKQESGFNPSATSKAGAMGLMQLMPATAKHLGVKDAYNPVQNVEGGVKYLKSMLNKYNGNIILALAAYNAGPGAVDKYSGVPPYQETQNYVKNILANYL